MNKKIWLIIGAAFAAWFFLIRKATGASGTATPNAYDPGIDPTIAQAVATTALTNWGVTGPITVSKADQSLYPGWYKTSDGGWANPDTGEFYSPGSSPPIYHQMGAYSTGEMVAPIIDLSETFAPAVDTYDPNNVNDPRNGYVIF
jgi:hypothetical protein